MTVKTKMRLTLSEDKIKIRGDKSVKADKGDK